MTRARWMGLALAGLVILASPVLAAETGSQLTTPRRGVSPKRLWQGAQRRVGDWVRGRVVGPALARGVRQVRHIVAESAATANAAGLSRGVIGFGQTFTYQGRHAPLETVRVTFKGTGPKARYEGHGSRVVMTGTGLGGPMETRMLFDFNQPRGLGTIGRALLTGKLPVKVSGYADVPVGLPSP